MQIRGVEGDFLVLAYDGADRLYLPVAKLRQVQKFTGASPEHGRLDQLGGQSFALRKARVKEQLLKMAAELLDIYAARAAHPGPSRSRSRTRSSASSRRSSRWTRRPTRRRRSRTS